MEPSDLFYLLRVRVPIPLPFVAAAIAFGVAFIPISWIAEKMEKHKGKMESIGTILCLIIAIFVAREVCAAGYAYWPW